MLDKIKKIRLRPAFLLMALFLTFCLYVGSAAVPTVIYHLKCAIGARDAQYFVHSLDQEYESMLDTDLQYTFLQNKGTYINLNGLMANLLNQPEMNDRVKLKNGHLSSLVTTRPQDEELETIALTMEIFQSRQEERGGHFLFLLAPSQIGKYEDLLPTGYTDTTNETADRLLVLLQERGIAYLDLREEMYLDGLTTADTHYTTDHHWTPQTGVWAYSKILEALEQMGAIGAVNPHYCAPEQFSYRSYPDSFLGSSGKRTGIYYAGLDSSDYIIPNFDHQLSLTVDSRTLSLTGRYEEICFNTDVHTDHSNPDFFYDNFYGLYGWGDNDLAQWRNPNAPEQSRVLMIGESFGNIPFSLLPLYFSQCDELDMRYYTGDFLTYYEQFQPDTVILEVNVDMVTGVILTYPYFQDCK